MSLKDWDGPDVVAIILALAFAVCFFCLLVFPVEFKEPGVAALKDIWLVIVGALAGYIARDRQQKTPVEPPDAPGTRPPEGEPPPA